MNTMGKMAVGAAKLAGATVVVVLVGSGTLGVAHAVSAAVADNSVNSAKIVNNSIQSIDVRDGALTNADIQNGTIGEPDLARNLRPHWAKVAVGPGAETALIRGRGVVSVARTGNGEYDVTFDFDIDTCGWIATRNDDTVGGAGPGEIAVEQATSADATRVRVRLFNSAGTQTDPESDDGFTVMAIC